MRILTADITSRIVIVIVVAREPPIQRRSQDFCIGGFQMGIVIVNVKPSTGGARPLGGCGGMPPREISKFVVPRNGISLILSINF